MTPFLQDSTNQIVSEANLSNVLSHFNTELIFDMVEDNINNRFNNYQSVIPNIISAYEANFKQLLLEYPMGQQEINEVREETYMEIIDMLCNRYNLTYNYEGQHDVYSSAFTLYQFLVSAFRNNIVAFFANFIYKEKNNLYESLQLAQFRKNKDSNSIYNKKIYKNPKLAVIVSKIDYVIDSICRFDIDFLTMLKYMTPDKNIIDFINTIVAPNIDFFKQFVVPTIQGVNRSMIVMDIRIAIQNQAQLNEVNIVDNEQ